MCGIAGYVGTRELDPARLDRTLASMHHRGPDDAAWHHAVNRAGRHVYLLHTRLTIIDLDPRSNQPYRVGSKLLTYNGELYNYVELRAELERLGTRFRTTSDTEVLLLAIDRLGWEVLDRFEGMYGFGVYDEADGSLTLCRDRFGEKPLYLYRDETGLYFGSEVKFVQALLDRRLRVDYDHLYRYLVNGYRALHKTSQTFFEGITELAPGTILSVDAAGAERVERYWRPAEPQPSGASYAEVVAGVRERLIRSVELRLRADVPLAFCMSGGIDSLSLISTAKRVFDYDVHGFTIVNEDERYEEQEMVEYSVRELGIRHTDIVLDTEGFLGRMRELVRHHDAPVATISYYAHWLLMKSIAEHGYRVSVSGTAGDELFSGYYDHHLAYLYDVRDEREVYEPALAAWERHVRPEVRNPYLRDPRLFFENPGQRDYLYLNSDEFSGYLHCAWSEPFREETYAGDVLRNRMLNELFVEAVPVVLHEDDANAMSFSIENRSPFLDRELFDYAATIPTRYLVRDGRAKAVLRDAMDGIVPPDVLTNRRKVGFNAPIFALLDREDPAVRAELLGTSPIFDHVRRDRIEQLLDREFLPNSESKLLFNFVNVKLFLEAFGGD
jgi:asparagine synthase (glutamine-hydrolysing)